MCTALTLQVRSVAEVMTSVAKGDLTTLIDIEAEGEIAVLKNTVNAMVAQLRIFAREVIRVALEGERTSAACYRRNADLSRQSAQRAFSEA